MGKLLTTIDRKMYKNADLVSRVLKEMEIMINQQMRKEPYDNEFRKIFVSYLTGDHLTPVKPAD